MSKDEKSVERRFAVCFPLFVKRFPRIDPNVYSRARYKKSVLARLEKNELEDITAWMEAMLSGPRHPRSPIQVEELPL